MKDKQRNKSIKNTIGLKIKTEKKKEKKKGKLHRTAKAQR